MYVYIIFLNSDFDITAKGETSVKQLQQALIQLKIIHFKHWFDGK